MKQEWREEEERKKKNQKEKKIKNKRNYLKLRVVKLLSISPCIWVLKKKKILTNSTAWVKCLKNVTKPDKCLHNIYIYNNQ